MSREREWGHHGAVVLAEHADLVQQLRTQRRTFPRACKELAWVRREVEAGARVWHVVSTQRMQVEEARPSPGHLIHDKPQFGRTACSELASVHREPVVLVESVVFPPDGNQTRLLVRRDRSLGPG